MAAECSNPASSIYHGVYRLNNGKFYGKIWEGDAAQYLGVFTNEEAAARTYDTVSYTHLRAHETGAYL
eukprot:8836568-Pyramimonas_sp.AAC.2